MNTVSHIFRATGSPWRRSARTGHLYPPPFDGEHYAGTRWMPLAILANALASALVGDPLIGGKLLAAVLLVTLLGLCATVLRQVSCPRSITAALCASVIATETGLQAGTTIGGDLLPVVLQVGAVVAALRGGDGALVIAGALAGLALTSKLTAVWATSGRAHLAGCSPAVASRRDLRRREYSDRGCRPGRGGSDYERRIVETLTLVLNGWRGRYPFALARSQPTSLQSARLRVWRRCAPTVSWY